MPEELKEENCSGPTGGICGNPDIFHGPEYAPPSKGGKIDKPKKIYPTSSAPVPTLPYVPAKSHPADENLDGGYGRGKKVENNDKADAPATTPAPKLKDQAMGGQRILSTSTYTEAGVVHEIVIVEQDVYVTLDSYAKRHAHAHRH